MSKHYLTKVQCLSSLHPAAPIQQNGRKSRKFYAVTTKELNQIIQFNMAFSSSQKDIETDMDSFTNIWKFFV